MAKISSLIQMIGSFSKVEREKISSVMDIQNSKHNYRTEKMELKVTQKSYDNLSGTERKEECEKTALKIKSFKNDKFKIQLTNTFDFNA